MSHLLWWFMGFALGFQLWYKLPLRVRRALAMLCLLWVIFAGLSMITSFRRGANASSNAAGYAPKKAWRDLGPIYLPTRKMLPASDVTADESHNGNQAKQLALPAQKQANAIAVSPNQQMSFTACVNNTCQVTINSSSVAIAMWPGSAPATITGGQTWVMSGPSGTISSTATSTITTSPTASAAYLAQIPGLQKSGGRKGPFCRVTCNVHHASSYDVEAEAELCRAGRIEPRAEEVMGWAQIATDDNGQAWERLQPWPGPGSNTANEAGPYHYKLYWKGK